EGGSRGLLWPFREGFVGPPRPPRATGSSRKDRRPPRARGNPPCGASDLSPNTAFLHPRRAKARRSAAFPNFAAQAGEGAANSSLLLPIHGEGDRRRRWRGSSGHDEQTPSVSAAARPIHLS